jgi:hypothetical protein
VKTWERKDEEVEMATFEVRVPNDDDGESLGMFDADTVPRIGERFCINGHPEVCRTANDCFIGIVDDVAYEATCSAKGGGRWATDITVWLREEHGTPVLYCECTTPSPDAEGNCDDCRKRLRKSQSSRGE